MLTPPVICPFAVILWGNQSVEAADFAVVGLLFILEGVLSIDNAIVLGILAKRLPKSQRPRALSYGLIGAFVFRLLAIGTATFLLKWTFVKFLGGAYLIYIALKHLFFESQEEEPDTLIVDAEGAPQLVDSITHAPISAEREELELKERLPFDFDGSGVPPQDTVSSSGAIPAQRTVKTSTADRHKFWWTVFVIEMTDIAFAVDSIVAAIGVVGSAPPGTPEGALHPKLWVVILGGFLGVVVMRFAAAIFIRLLERFPRLELAAYLLVIVIGLKLLADWAFNSDWSSWGITANQRWAVGYLEWLKLHWPLPLSPRSFEHPHLLDFHDLRRPECILFWLSMVASFAVGFLPRRAGPPGHSGSPVTQPSSPK